MDIRSLVPQTSSKEVLSTVGSAGTSHTLDPAATTYDITLTAASCALTLPTDVSQVANLLVLLRQDATGGRVVTWPGNVTWLGDGNPPPLNTTPAGVTILSLFTINGGASWLGSGTIEQVPTVHKSSHAPGGSDAIDYTLVHRAGVLTNRPVAASANNGLYYFVTDERGGTLYRSNGAKWEQQGNPLGDALHPTALAYTTFRRAGTPIANSNVLASGRRHLVAIDLPAGVTVSSIAFVTGGTAAGSPTHQFFELFDQNRARLGATVDDGATAWGANTRKTLALTAPFTTTYAGLHYLGITVVATTVPTLFAVASSATVLALPPIISGLADTGLVDPGSAPTTAAALTAAGNIPYAGVA